MSLQIQPFLQIQGCNNNSSRVVHNYIDFANNSQHDWEVARRASANRPRGGVAVPFPSKLHIMLNQVEKCGLSHIVSFQPHGRAFLVHKPHEFVSTVMPYFFNQTKLQSFQRQLNLYGFQRLTLGRDRGGYYHPLFLRGREFLAREIKRTRIKGLGMRVYPDPDTEPNFYNMPFVFRGSSNNNVGEPISTTNNSMISSMTSPSSSFLLGTTTTMPLFPSSIMTAAQETRGASMTQSMMLSSKSNQILRAVAALPKTPTTTTTTANASTSVVKNTQDFLDQLEQLNFFDRRNSGTTGGTIGLSTGNQHQLVLQPQQQGHSVESSFLEPIPIKSVNQNSSGDAATSTTTTTALSSSSSSFSLSCLLPESEPPVNSSGG